MIVRASLSGDDAVSAARRFAERFVTALADYRSAAYRFGETVRSLVRVQPIVALDLLLLEQEGKPSKTRAIPFDHQGGRLFDTVPEEVLIAWAEVNLEDRCPRLASVISYFQGENTQGTLEWSGQGLRLLDLAPNKRAFLTEIAYRLHSNSWSGSRADMMEKRRQLVTALVTRPEPEIADWAHEQNRFLHAEIERERARERKGDESFE